MKRKDKVCQIIFLSWQNDMILTTMFFTRIELYFLAKKTELLHKIHERVAECKVNEIDYFKHT